MGEVERLANALGSEESKGIDRLVNSTLFSMAGKPDFISAEAVRYHLMQIQKSYSHKEMHIRSSITISVSPKIRPIYRMNASQQSQSAWNSCSFV